MRSKCKLINCWKVIKNNNNNNMKSRITKKVVGKSVNYYSLEFL